MNGPAPAEAVLASHMQEFGQSAPSGLFLTVLLALAIVLLVRSMTRHLRRIPPSFDGDDGPRVVVPDTPAELVDPPGQELLDRLRQAPRAIEAPRSDRRPDDDPPR